jgi:hypothetical protein
MKYIIYIIILLVILFAIWYLMSSSYEHFGMGVYDQLTAKGPLDTYLTTGTKKYLPQNYFPYYPFRSQLWNNPTRVRSYYWPIYYDPTYFPWYYLYA